MTDDYLEDDEFLDVYQRFMEHMPDEEDPPIPAELPVSDNSDNAEFIDFDKFISLIKEGLISIANNELGGFITQFFNDTIDFVNAQIQRVTRWMGMYVKHQIEKDELNFLLAGLFDLMEMHALTQLGYSIIVIQKVRKALINLVIDAAIASIII